MTLPRVLVIAAHRPGGEAAAPQADLVVAADGGLDVARALGCRVDAVVGDLDSASAAALDWARSIGAEFETHPPRKDQTDLELAMQFAGRRGSEIHVLASVGGRLDHAAANLLVLASPRWAGVPVSATIDGSRVDVVRGRRTLGGDVGDTLSLLPVGGPARIVSSCGLAYRLVDEWLDPTAARGVSNVIADVPVVLDVADGVVLAIRPSGSRH